MWQAARCPPPRSAAGGGVVSQTFSLNGQRVRKRLLDGIKAGPDRVEALLRLNSITKHIERIADMATNVAEDVIYMVEGEIVRHRADE